MPNQLFLAQEGHGAVGNGKERGMNEEGDFCLFSLPEATKRGGKVGCKGGSYISARKEWEGVSRDSPIPASEP